MKHLPLQTQNDSRRCREAIRKQIDSTRSDKEKRERDILMAQRNAYDSLPSSDKKELDEMEIFCTFAEAARLNAEPDSMRSEKPPKPDIGCRIAGELTFFELGRIVDENVAKAFYPAFRSGGVSAATAYDPLAPLIRMFQGKADSRYDTNGSRVDLVLYFYEQSPDWTPTSEYLNRRLLEIDAMIHKSQFNVVWLFDMWSNSILWRRERRAFSDAKSDVNIADERI